MATNQRWMCKATAVFISSLAMTAAAAVPVPLPSGDKPIDVAKVRVDNPSVVSTGGDWRFRLTHGEMADGKYKSMSAWASASSTQLPAGNAIDGKSDTRWCAENADMPQWWQVDFGKTEQVAGIGISWEASDGQYSYTIESGPDEKHLKQVVARTGGDEKISWPTTPARILRIKITKAADGNGDPKWASIREASITVDHDGKSVVWSPPDANEAPGTHDNDFAATEFSDAAWDTIPVPSNWEVLGFSKPTYENPDNAVGLYRRIIDIPESFAGKQVLWHFDGVTDSAEIWVNGKHIGYHEGGFTAFDIDVSSAIKPGKNLLAVRVCKTTPTVDLDTGDYWLLGGIHRESYLVALPTDYLSDLTVVTTLDDNYKNATVHTVAKVTGKPGNVCSVTEGLFTADGTPVDADGTQAEDFMVTTGQKIGEDGSAEVKLTFPVKAPKLWSAEKPNLYYTMLTLKVGGTVVETIEQRFGIRQIDIKDGVLLLNGTPIKCTGTCRHEEWSALGHALTEHEWQTDVAMMKAANINAVRTSHYNHAERFLELCDEKGIYVLDEIPACWVNPNDPKLKAAFVQHATEALARDKNKPSVIAWSCGNESGWGPNFKAMVDYVATTDPTRPRFVSEVSKSKDPMLSISDHHYPQDSSLKKIATTDAGPSVITEGPHIFYNIGHQAYDYGLNDLWGMALAGQWDRVWPSKPLFGAFIWEWQDQGLADKFPDKSKVNAEGLRSENSKGIVTGYRVPKPEYYHVKMVYSPVTSDQREVRIAGDRWAANFQNRYAFTDLSELTCRWQAMTTATTDAEIAHGAAPVSCPPGKSVDVTFPITPSADTLRVSFINHNNIEVYATRLHIPGSAVPQPPAAMASSMLGWADQIGAIGGANTGASNGVFTISIDQKAGRVELSSGENTTTFNPTLNLGEARFDDGDFGNKNDAPWIESKAPPLLKDIHVTGGMSGDVWQATISGLVSLTEKPDDTLALLTCELTAHGDGQIDWAYHLKWTAIDMQAWELGLKFNIVGDDEFSWYRKAQWTEYPAGHIGAVQGKVNHTDRSFASTKRDTIWAAVTGKAGGIAVLATDGPLHTRCNFADGATTLFVSSAVSVDRDFSSGYVDYTRIMFKQGHTYDGAFKMRVIAK